MDEIYNFSEIKMMLKREALISRFKHEERSAELQSIEDTFKKIYKDPFKAIITKHERKLIAKQAAFNE